MCYVNFTVAHIVLLMEWGRLRTLDQAYSMEGSAQENSSSGCHTFSAKQIQDITVAYAVVAAAGAVMCLVSIIVIMVLKQYDTFVHRLALYLMVVGFFQGITTGLQVAPVHHNGEEVEVRHGLKGLCIAFAFAVQVTVFQLMMVLTWILVYLFLLVIFNYKADSKKQEIAGLVITLGLPLLLNLLPFIHNLYGLAGAWCWIRATSSDCQSLITLGIIFQIALFYGPKTFLVLLSFMMFLVIAVTLCRQSCNRSGRGQRSPYQQAVRQALPLLLYPVLYNLIVGVMIANRVDYAIAIAHDRKPYYPLFLAHAISDPMRILFIPVAFLLHPDTVRKLLRKDRPKRNEDSRTNFPVSQESCFSEVEPLIIRGSANSDVNSDYKSIFDADAEAP